MANVNRVAVPSLESPPGDQWDTAFRTGEGPSWDDVASLANQMPSPSNNNPEQTQESSTISGIEIDPSIAEQRELALNSLFESIDLSANQEQFNAAIEEFKSRSRGLWSHSFITDIAKRFWDVFEPGKTLEGPEASGFYWEIIRNFDAPISLALEEKSIYQAMLDSEQKLGEGRLGEIYQTMAATEDGKEKFRKDFIESGRYSRDLFADIDSIYSDDEYDEKIVLDLKTLKSFGVNILEGTDSGELVSYALSIENPSRYKEYESKVYETTKFLINNGLFGGDEYAKSIRDILDSDFPRSAGSAYSIVDAALEAGLEPETDDLDVEYWNDVSKKSGENMLRLICLSEDGKKLQEKLDFSNEAVMKLFSKANVNSMSSTLGRLQDSQLREALRRPVFQDIIMQTLEERMKRLPQAPMNPDEPPFLFMMLAQDGGIIEDMKRRKVFDNYPECQNNNVIRRVASDEFKESDRIDMLLKYGNYQSVSAHPEWLDENGDLNSKFLWDIGATYRETPYFLSDNQKQEIADYRTIMCQIEDVRKKHQSRVIGSTFPIFETCLKYFDVNGPKPEFWQASLNVKDFQFLSSQDAETKASMGFDETTMAFIDGAAGKVFAGEKRTIDESNAIQALMRFIDKDADDWSNSSEDDLLIKEAFDGNDVKDLSLAKLRSLYEEYLKNGNSMQFPNVLTAMADYMHSKGGAGPLTQIEAFLDYAGVLGNSMQEAKKDDDWRNELITNVATIEEMMQKYRWDNQEKSNFYATSAEIINASPELFQEFTQLFVNNLSKEEFKAFTGEIYPLYRAKLALLREYEDHSNGIGEGYTTIKYNPYDIDNLKNQLHTALLPFNCKEVSLEKRRKGIERVKENIFSEISELFKTKFSILPEAIPSELSKADARVVGDMTRYLGSLAQPSQQKKDILGFYLALQLDRDQTAWKKIRSGEDVSPSNYLDIVSSFGVKQAVEQSRRNNPITLESTRIDNPERLIKFRRALQSETVSMRFGNIQTVDLRLQNLRGNMEELIDPDLYPEGIDRQRVELLRELPSQKEFNKIIGTIQQRMMGKDIPLTDEGRLIMGRVEQILKDNDLEVNTNNIKQYFQTDMKTIQAPFRILGSIDSYGVVDSIRELQAMLNPPDSVAQILEKLGETPKPQSGIMALGADLDYLENLMVKRANELTADESNTLGEYLNSIRKKLTELDGIYGKVIENYNTMKKNGVHPSTLNQIKEIDKIISNEANQSIITTTCANDMTTIIENMRACLSCVTKGINNDTNLTFGEGYKFYLYSRENASRNSSVADEIVYFVPSEDEGGANKRLSFVMDQVYGMKNSDIMMAHIETMLKKAHELKSEFPEVPISVILPGSSIMSCSTSLDAAELSRRIGSGDGFEDIRDKTVTVPESGFGDHYIEFGDRAARISGPRKVSSGIEIVINPTTDPQLAMVNNG